MLPRLSGYVVVFNKAKSELADRASKDTTWFTYLGITRPFNPNFLNQEKLDLLAKITKLLDHAYAVLSKDEMDCLRAAQKLRDEYTADSKKKEKATLNEIQLLTNAAKITQKRKRAEEAAKQGKPFQENCPEHLDEFEKNLTDFLNYISNKAKEELVSYVGTKPSSDTTLQSLTDALSQLDLDLKLFRIALHQERLRRRVRAYAGDKPFEKLDLAAIQKANDEFTQILEEIARVDGEIESLSKENNQNVWLKEIDNESKKIADDVKTLRYDLIEELLRRMEKMSPDEKYAIQYGNSSPEWLQCNTLITNNGTMLQKKRLADAGEAIPDSKAVPLSMGHDYLDKRALGVSMIFVPLSSSMIASPHGMQSLDSLTESISSLKKLEKPDATTVTGVLEDAIAVYGKEITNDTDTLTDDIKDWETMQESLTISFQLLTKVEEPGAALAANASTATTSTPQPPSSSAATTPSATAPIPTPPATSTPPVPGTKMTDERVVVDLDKKTVDKKDDEKVEKKGQKKEDEKIDKKEYEKEHNKKAGSGLEKTTEKVANKITPEQKTAIKIAARLETLLTSHQRRIEREQEGCWFKLFASEEKQRRTTDKIQALTEVIDTIRTKGAKMEVKSRRDIANNFLNPLFANKKIYESRGDWFESTLDEALVDFVRKEGFQFNKQTSTSTSSTSKHEGPH